MQVGNIECQIAKTQIGNYLAGAGLSEEALTQLEDHLSGCAECKKVLAERRAELLALLAEEATPAPTADLMEEPEGSAKSIAAALRQKSLQAVTSKTQTPAAKPVAQAAVQIEAPDAAKPNSFWKPMSYSLALGAVLVGMSLFSKNAGNILGNKVADSLPEKAAAIVPPIAEKKSSTAPAKDLEPKVAATVEAPKPEQTKPVATDLAQKPPTTTKPLEKTTSKRISTAPQKPANQAAPRPRAAIKPATIGAPTVKKTTVRPIGRRAVRTTRKPTRRVPQRTRPTGIRIYDPSGKPL